MVFIFLAYFTLYKTMEYYSAIKKNPFESILMRWMILVLLKMLSKIHQLNRSGSVLYFFAMFLIIDLVPLVIIGLYRFSIPS